MNYSFDINKIKKLYNDNLKGYVLSKTSFEKDSYAIELDTYGSILNLLTGVKLPQIYYDNKTLDNYNKSTFMNIESLLYLKDIAKKIVNQNIPYSASTKKTTISHDMAIDYAIYSLLEFDKNEAFFLKNIIDKKNIALSSKKIGNTEYRGMTFPSLKKNESYIFVLTTNKIEDVSTIVHELGHAYQFSFNNDSSDLFNFSSSQFNEVFSILHELIFRDTMLNLIDRKECLNLQYIFMETLRYYISSIITSKDKNTVVYGYSSLIAYFLYYLYKVDRKVFNEDINILNNMIYNNTDEEIVKSLGITSNNLKTSYDYYVKEYKRNKIRK